MDPSRPPRLLPAAQLGELLAALRAGGRMLVGPVLRDGAVVLDPVERLEDLARGWKDRQAPGHYRLRREGEAWFGAVIGPDSLKRWLYPPRVRLWRAERDGTGFRVEGAERRPPRLAVIGLRACDLAGVAIQDRVLRHGEHPDPHYALRRSDLLVVAVQCSEAVSTCFCASMGAGPRVRRGFDLCLTEVLEPDHHFVVEIGSEAGAHVLARLDTSLAPDPAVPDRAARAAEAGITRRLPTEGLAERLAAAVPGPHWQQVAQRCLGCGSCTMVCPTCFCSQVTDLTDLAGGTERVRTWDSCFTLGHSYVHGGAVRDDLFERYRQWLTHKLSTWHDQLGTPGCTGCGRCVTWCPAGIDLVAEALAAAGPPAADPPAAAPSPEPA